MEKRPRMKIQSSKQAAGETLDLAHLNLNYQSQQSAAAAASPQGIKTMHMLSV